MQIDIPANLAAEHNLGSTPEEVALDNPFLQDRCTCNEDIPAYRCILTDGDILTGKENIAFRLPIKGERLPRSINIADHRPVDGNRLGSHEQIAVDVAVDPDILPGHKRSPFNISVHLHHIARKETRPFNRFTCS